MAKDASSLAVATADNFEELDFADDDDDEDIASDATLEQIEAGRDLEVGGTDDEAVDDVVEVDDKILL